MDFLTNNLLPVTLQATSLAAVSLSACGIGWFIYEINHDSVIVSIWMITIKETVCICEAVFIVGKPFSFSFK